MYPTAPHPTPVATGKGNRTAAPDEELFSRYLSDHLTVPDLSLPETTARRRRPPRLPSIDLSSLMISSSSPAHPRIMSCDAAVVVLPLIRAAIADVGAFRIVNHGLSPDLIGSASTEEQYGSFLPHALDQYRRRCYRYKLPRKLGIESTSMNISAQVESVCLEMEKIAQALSNMVFHKYIFTGRRPAGKSSTKSSTTYNTEPVMWLRVYKNKSAGSDGDNEEEEEEEEQDPDRAFTLQYLILGDSELQLRRHNSIIASFSTKPGSLLVTTGKQLREWSRLDEDQLVRNSMEEVVMITSPCTTRLTVWIQLVWPLSSLTQLEPASRGVGTTISIFDQILIVMLIALSYDLLKYLQSL